MLLVGLLGRAEPDAPAPDRQSSAPGAEDLEIIEAFLARAREGSDGEGQ
jgi:hypothetical protein